MFNTISRWLNIQTADAHCDVPCGVYDPSTAQVAAKTVNALTKKIIDLSSRRLPLSPKNKVLWRTLITRIIRQRGICLDLQNRDPHPLDRLFQNR